MTVKVKKSPRAADIAIGRRIRLRRMAIGMSQQAVANKLKLSFQQLQKYENGTNRVGGSRLHEIAVILGVQPHYFFATIDNAETGEGMFDAGTRMMTMKDGIAMANAFIAIADRTTRAHLVAIAQRLAGQDISQPDEIRSAEPTASHPMQSPLPQ